MGPLRVKQPLPGGSVQQVSPFLLIHHAGPKQIHAGEKHGRIEPHPHTGFSPVTFVFSGEVFHKDSLGNEGLVGAGGVQWMNAGKGIVHSEGPSPEFLAQGGTLEMIQLWINLPAKNKFDQPYYHNITKEEIPDVSVNNGEIVFHVAAGEYLNTTGPAKIHSSLVAMTADVKTSENFFALDFPDNWNVSFYVLNGTIETALGEKVEALHYGIFERKGGTVNIRATADARLLILAGEPIMEPVVSYGSFVMNTREEIQQAIVDFQEGRMGDLDY